MSGIRMLSEANRSLLLLELHKLIEESAEETARALVERSWEEQIAYPPNAGFTRKEKDALNAIPDIRGIESAMRKVIADAAARPLHALLCIVDGVADPEGGGWTGVSLLDRETTDAEGMFLHTDFFDQYWEWRRVRPGKGWKLDVYDGDPPTEHP